MIETNSVFSCMVEIEGDKFLKLAYFSPNVSILPTYVFVHPLRRLFHSSYAYIIRKRQHCDQLNNFTTIINLANGTTFHQILFTRNCVPTVFDRFYIDVIAIILNGSLSPQNVTPRVNYV